MTGLLGSLSRGFRGAFDVRPSLFLWHAPWTRRLLQLERQLHTLTLEFRQATRRERERIACRLHDEIGQQLALIRLKLQELHGSEFEAAKRLLEELTTLTARTAETTRKLTHEFGASLAGHGLSSMLGAIAQELSRQTGIEVRLDLSPQAHDLPEPQRAVACRVVREFCRNVQKHAQARRVSISSQVHGRALCIEVKDDGQGMHAPLPRLWQARADGGFGLASAQAQLRALGGDLQLHSKPRLGTRARLTLPLASA